MPRRPLPNPAVSSYHQSPCFDGDETTRFETMKWAVSHGGWDELVWLFCSTWIAGSFICESAKMEFFMGSFSASPNPGAPSLAPPGFSNNAYHDMLMKSGETNWLLEYHFSIDFTTHLFSWWSTWNIFSMRKSTCWTVGKGQLCGVQNKEFRRKSGTNTTSTVDDIIWYLVNSQKPMKDQHFYWVNNPYTSQPSPLCEIPAPPWLRGERRTSFLLHRL